jgi:hypothetical protein
MSSVPVKSPRVPVAIEHRDAIIEHLAKGDRLIDVIAALNLDVGRGVISHYLKSDPEYREAIEQGFMVRLDRAENGIEQANEQLDVARARALFQSVAWRAEREFPEVWGAKSQVSVTTVSIDQSLDGLAASLLDKMRVVSTQPEDDDS